MTPEVETALREALTARQVTGADADQAVELMTRPAFLDANGQPDPAAIDTYADFIATPPGRTDHGAAEGAAEARRRFGTTARNADPGHTTSTTTTGTSTDHGAAAGLAEAARRFGTL